MIETLEQFKTLLGKYEEACGDAFDEAMLEVHADGSARYRTIFRDEGNNKMACEIFWDGAGSVDWECGYPEAGDVISNLVEAFKPAGQRTFTVYAKLTVKADSLEDALLKVDRAIKPLSDIKGESFSDARTAQFG